MERDNTRFVILYAEDDIDDLHMVQDCFQQYSHLIGILHAENGAEALHSLDGLQAKGITPCLIIWDINMPGMDGREALLHIKSSNDYKDIPVVLFTTSNSSLDKTFAQKWGADFITKPLKYEEIMKLAYEFASRCSKEVRKRA